MLFLYTLENVTKLTAENFDINRTKIVKFFQPWCGHCIQLAPLWEEISNLINETDVAEVNCSAEAALCGRFGVHSWPSIQAIVDNVSTPFSGMRDKDKLLLWGRDITLKQFPRFYTWDEAKKDAKVKGYENFFVLFSNTLENPDFEKYKGYVKIYCVQSEAQMLIAYQDGVITRFNSEQVSAEAINAFLDSHRDPYFIQYDNKIFSEITKKNVTFFIARPGDHQFLLDELKSDLVRHGDAKHFNRCWMNGSYWYPFVETFPLMKKEDIPLVLIIDYTNEKYYWSQRVLEGQSAFEVIERLEAEIEAGLKPTLKEEKKKEEVAKEEKKEEEKKMEEQKADEEKKDGEKKNQESGKQEEQEATYYGRSEEQENTGEEKNKDEL